MRRIYSQVVQLYGLADVLTNTIRVAVFTQEDIEIAIVDAKRSHQFTH